MVVEMVGLNVLSPLLLGGLHDMASCLLSTILLQVCVIQELMLSIM